jgi:hypothetical protein
MTNFHEAITSFIWYTVEFVANISVIYYILIHKLKLTGSAPPIVKQDVPATLHDTIKGTAGFMTGLTETVKAARSLVSSVTNPEGVPPTPSAPPASPVIRTPGGRK